MLPVFVYGTLRTGSWNHDRWLAPWLAGPTEPATLAGHALHHHGGLPYVTPAPGHAARGELARLDPARYDDALARLDELEDIEHRHYDRVEVQIEVTGERAFVYVAGPRIAAALSTATRVDHGDFLRLGDRSVPTAAAVDTGMTDTAPELGPAADRMASLVRGVPDEALGDPTPCPGYTVAGLLDHIDGFVRAFIDAAAKVGDGSGSGRTGSADALADDWRERLPGDLARLAAAWREPAASEGMSFAGGSEMPAPVVGLVALEELTVHGWDLAAALGQPFVPTDGELDAVLGFFAGFPDDPEVRGDAFGRVVPVADGAPRLDRVLAASGRDPGWATSR